MITSEAMPRTKGRAEVEKKARQLAVLKVEYVDMDALRPNDYNPNRQSDHDFELLMKSMSEDGFTQPIIAHTGDGKIARGTIVDGEHRWRAAGRLGYKQVPVVFVDMDPAQMKISTLRHNRARGSEDMELSVDVLRDLQKLGELDWAQESLMISDTELNRLLEDIPAPEAMADPDYAQAWEPDSLGNEARAATDTTLQEANPTLGIAMSLGALEAKRAREKELAKAKTAEQRQMIHQDSRQDLYRLQLVFSGEEAGVVRSALGNRPAETLLAMCRSSVGRVPDK